MPDEPLPDLNALSLPGLWEELASTGFPRRLLELARDEDLGEAGDVTARVTGREDSAGRDEIAADLVLREAGVVAGLAVAPLVCEVFAERLARPARFEPVRADGETVEAGTVVGRLLGPRESVVTIERTLLNLVGRLSGVATRTAAFVRAVEGTGARILDTRKTTPGLRVLEKYAVRCGGGMSHRFGLFDAVLVKDNHVAGLDLDGFEARIEVSVRSAANLRSDKKIWFVQVEADTPEQFARVVSLEAGLVDVVLLDNFTCEQLAAAVRIRSQLSPGLLLEASGGVRLETVRAVAETGVERISIGGLTHHAVSLDVGLDVPDAQTGRRGPDDVG